MKKTILLALLAMGVVTVLTAETLAWRKWNRYESVIVCRPYNAFTPICYGRMTCDGCCPSPCCAPMALPSFNPWAMGPCSVGCDPCAMAGPMMPPSMPVAMPLPTPPPPLAGPSVTMAPMHPGVYPVNYQPYGYPMAPYYGYAPMPMMNPGYMPASFNPYMPTGYAPGYGAPGCGYPGCAH